MSSPYSPETKRGTEESIEAMKHARTWLSRIDTRNDASNISVGSMNSELDAEIERVKEEYTAKTVEREVDNYVFNHEDEVEEMLTGGLDAKVSRLDELRDYVTEEFGYVSPPTLSKENLLWLVAQILLESHIGYQSEYDERPAVANLDLDSIGVPPEQWQGESFPLSSY